MRPSRIILGEVRAEDCPDLLLALNAGVPGAAAHLETTTPTDTRPEPDPALARSASRSRTGTL